jgi:peptidoglycan/LPS O-acetylase OafA/YrhL
MMTGTPQSQVGPRLGYIDGLRAIAVSAVLLFHFGVKWIPQGFLGVDVFFVISGYVISRSLAAGEARGSIVDYLEHFYRRRFWRLIPALVAMVAITLILTYFFIPRSYLTRHILLTGIAGVTGVSNIVLFLSSGGNYFGWETDFNPFIHTWSLGVEEQFYFIFPLLFWMAGLSVLPLRDKARPGLGSWLMVVLFLSSLIVAIWWGKTWPTAAFYLLFSRFWELAIGVFAFEGAEFITTRLANVRARLSLAWFGCALVIACLVNPFNAPSPFPAAILPSLGTVLVLWLGPQSLASPAAIGRWLSSGIMTYIGRISYSLYLWHWPVVVLLRWTVGFSQPGMALIASALSILLASGSYFLIEQPCQRSRLAGRTLRPNMFFMAIGTILFLIVSEFIIGLPRDFRIDIPSSSVTAHRYGWNNNDLPGIGTPKPQFGVSNHHKLVVLGDSHAGTYAGVSTATANALGYAVTISAVSGCGFTLIKPIEKSGKCRSQFAVLDAAGKGDVVLFAALRVPRYNDEDGIPQPAYDPDTLENRASRSSALNQLTEVARRLRSRGVVVMIDSPKPLFRYIAFRCADWFDKTNPVCEVPTAIPRTALIARGKPASDAISALKAAVPDVEIWNVFDALCPGNQCSVFDSRGNPMYFDTDHLTGWGSVAVLKSFDETMRTAIRRAASTTYGAERKIH